ncbi:MAG: A/G-specific adenine glycosylase, partial [Candidatus Eremiobacteraeota bacterium]|nr:A/G-specific adenine glycosylase [Candidatus Eremiobacteraeota bacterium]
LLRWYGAHGRTTLPWRASRDPYRIAVSEFMLQQTQVDRVAPAYEAFMERYPSFAALAAASRADVVRSWKGLGYNLRAVRLHELAIAVVSHHGGKLPSERDALRALSGIGPYTAAAIRAFAFELDDVAIDVNVRRVMHRLLFGLEHPPKASAAQLDSAAHRLLPKGRAHAWNSALMDLGATICTARAPKCGACPVRATCAASPHGSVQIAAATRAKLSLMRQGPQARLPFTQTRRYVRGRILDRLRELAPGAVFSPADLVAALNGAQERYPLDEILDGMERDGLVVRERSGIRLR